MGAYSPLVIRAAGQLTLRGGPFLLLSVLLRWTTCPKASFEFLATGDVRIRPKAKCCLATTNQFGSFKRPRRNPSLKRLSRHSNLFRCLTGGERLRTHRMQDTASLD